MFDAVFFDFDGLILDTELPDLRAWEGIYSSYDVEFPDWLWKEMIGRNIETVSVHPAQYLRENAKDAPTFEEAVQLHARKRLEVISLEKVLPGVRDRIEEAKTHHLPIAVVSSSSRGWVTRHLSNLALLDRFDALFCGYEGIVAKPDPDLYLAAIAHFKTRGEKCLAFEDSPNGIQAAKTAKMWCVSIPNELTKQLDLSAADATAESLAAASIARYAAEFGV